MPALGAIGARCAGAPRALVARLGIPLLAFALARSVLAAVAVSSGFGPFEASTWLRFDSGHYLAIAERGYELFDCARIGQYPGGWCGNTGWLPGFPWLIAPFAKLGVSPAPVGAAISALFQLLCLVVLWNGFLERERSAGAVLVVLLAAFFPGRVYHHAIFPVSMFTCFALTTLWLVLRERWGWAGLAGAVAAFTYSTGFVLAPVVASYLLLARGVPWRARARRIALAAGGVAAGFGAVLLVHAVTVGAWDAFFKVQAKYGHGLQSPLGTLVRALQPLFQGGWDGGTRAFPALQTLVVAAVVAWLALRPVVDAEPATARRELLFSLYALGFWLFPLSMGSAVSLARAESLLVPVVLLTLRRGLRAQWGLLVLFALLAIEMDRLFFMRALV